MKGTDIGWMLTIGMAGLGAAALLAPRPASMAYGAPQTDKLGKTVVRAQGLRTLGLAATLGGTLVFQPRLAIIPAATTAAIAAGDLLNVMATGKPRALPVATHLAGIAMGVATVAQIVNDR